MDLHLDPIRPDPKVIVPPAVLRELVVYQSIECSRDITAIEMAMKFLDADLPIREEFRDDTITPVARRAIEHGSLYALMRARNALLASIWDRVPPEDRE